MDNVRKALNIPYRDVKIAISRYDLGKVYLRSDLKPREVCYEGQEVIAYDGMFAVCRNLEREENIAFANMLPQSCITRYNSVYFTLVADNKWEEPEEKSKYLKSCILESDEEDLFKVIVVEHSSNILRILIRKSYWLKAFEKLEV